MHVTIAHEITDAIEIKKTNIFPISVSLHELYLILPKLFFHMFELI